MAEKVNNLQDMFLNALRRTKTPVTMFLVKGVKLQGIITWFDNFSVLLRRDGQSQLIYKHAISTVMPAHLSVAVDASAEALPFADRQFDASMATYSVHQWRDLATGLAEMRRVTKGPVVILSCDPDALDRFWLHEYCPEVTAVEAARYPPIDRLRDRLGGSVEVRPVSIPLDCRDGFNEAYYGRPEMLLDPEARGVCSGWSFVGREAAARFEATLRADLASGVWDRRFGHFRDRPFFEGPLRLIIARS